MANIKSAKKRVLIAKQRTEANKAAKSKLKTVLKRARAEEADAVAVKTAVVSIDKAAGKSLIHKNKAARLKSQLAKKANASA